MSLWNELNRGAQVALVGAVGALVIGAGYVGWQVSRPEAPAEVEVAVAPAVVAVAEPEPAADPEPEPELPMIDTWRVAQDGEALIAGLAVGGAKVEVLVDGKAVASGDAASSGEFAILFTLPANDQPSLMWLSMTLPEGGAVVTSEDRLALGPIKGPEPLAVAEVAVADPAPEPAPVAAPEPAPEPAPPPAGSACATHIRLVWSDSCGSIILFNLHKASGIFSFYGSSATSPSSPPALIVGPDPNPVEMAQRPCGKPCTRRGEF